MNSNKFCIVLIFLILLANNVNLLNILAVFPFEGISHYFVFDIYISELVKRGHNVTVISHFSKHDAPDNYNEIRLGGDKRFKEDFMPIDRSYQSILNTLKVIKDTSLQNCEDLLSNVQVQDLVSQRNEFDVIVVEQFNSDCALGIAYKLKAPVVGLTSNIIFPWHYERLGIKYNLLNTPSYCFEGGSRPTFYQRIERILFHSYFNLFYYYNVQKSNEMILSKYFNDIPPLNELARDIKFTLMYHNTILTRSGLFPSNVIEIGGFHISPSKELTGALRTFVEEAQHGVIYISFGSVAKITTLEPKKLEAIMEAIDEMPQRFIWKVRTGKELFMNMNKTKLYVDDWLPQTDILAHPNIRAFFSHCGMLSTLEALHYGVPVIAMPIFGDQLINAAEIEERGLGIQIELNQLTKENIVETFEKVLDPRIRQNARQLSKASRDRPVSSLDSAVFWTEFAARHSNLSFRPVAADVPLYQHLYLDVMVVVILSIILLYTVSKSLLDAKKRLDYSNKRKND